MHAIIKLDQPIRVVFLLVLAFSLRVILNPSTLVMRGGSYPYLVHNLTRLINNLIIASKNIT